MLMKFCSCIFWIINYVWWTFLKNLSSRFKDFRKKAHNTKLSNICHCSDCKKKSNFRNRENKISEIFTTQRYKLNTYFCNNLISSIEYLFLPSFNFIIQKLAFTKFLRFIRNQTYRIVLFLYIWFAIHQSLK